MANLKERGRDQQKRESRMTNIGLNIGEEGVGEREAIDIGRRFGQRGEIVGEREMANIN